MSAVWAEVGKGSQPIPNGAFFFLHKRISLSVVLNTNIANSSNRSFIPPIFVEPGTVPSMGDSAGNKIDRSPALMEFAFWRVGGGRFKRAGPQINPCAMCQGVWRAKEKKAGVPGPWCSSWRLSSTPTSSVGLKAPSVSLSSKEAGSAAPAALSRYGLCLSTPFSLPETPSAHASVGESPAVCCSLEVSGQLLGPPPGLPTAGH